MQILQSSPRLADWIELGLTTPEVIEEPIWCFPIEAMSAVDAPRLQEGGSTAETYVQSPWPVGHTLPFHHLRVNALFIGKVLNAPAPAARRCTRPHRQRTALS
jgi:hypothetical protein